MAAIAFDQGKVGNLKCLVLPGNRPPVGVLPYYNAAYSFWKEIWQKTLREVDGQANVFSDSFLRQDQFSSLFYGDLPVGLFFYSWIDLSLQSNCDHSYFEFYPKEVLASIRKSNDLVMTMGYLSVHPEWRKSIIGFSISDILMGLATRTFLESDAQALITFTRNDRKTNELCYRFGGRPLLRNQSVFNIGSDFILFGRDEVTDSVDPTLSRFIDHFWKSKVDAAKSIKRIIYRTQNQESEQKLEL